MNTPFPRMIAVLLPVVVACSSATLAKSGSGLESPTVARTIDASPDQQKPDTGRPPVNAADVHFMTGMIPHHAQAVLIARWALSHGASSAVRILCERIVVGQRDEIALMQTWLRERGKPVPDSNAMRMKMMMDGVEHEMLMPGMLTDDELATLDASTGPAFDRLFLGAMIRHHQGAISMVDEMFGSQGAGQDETVFRFASDVYADQTTEIDRMQKMLAAM